MPNKGRKSIRTDPAASDIVAFQSKQAVLNGVLAAKSDKQISLDTGIPKAVVKKLKQEIRNHITRNYHDTIEHVRSMAFSRMERLFRLTDQMTYGRHPSLPTGIPDIKWAKLSLELIRAQVELVKTDYERHLDADQDRSRFQYTEVNNLTLIANDDMYKLANDRLWQSWQELDSPDYRAMLLNDIVENDPDDEPDYASVQRKLNELERFIVADPGEEEDDDVSDKD